MAKGGHFAAMEQPDALAADIAAFFRGLRWERPCYSPHRDQMYVCASKRIHKKHADRVVPCDDPPDFLWAVVSIASTSRLAGA